MAGKSVNNNRVSFTDFDNVEYKQFPMSIISTKSAEEVNAFLKLKIRADNDIATHCVPAFLVPNTTVLL